MATMQRAVELFHEGRFFDSLSALNEVEVSGNERFPAEVLRAEILERLGRIGQSRGMVSRLLRAKGLPPALGSRCEVVLSRLESELGDIRGAIQHARRAVDLAKHSGKLEQVCWSQLRLVLLIGGGLRPELAASLLTELRSNVTKLGDPHVTAMLHIAVGNLDGRRGLFDTAARHTKIAQSILSTKPNVWLQAWAENNKLALALLDCDFDSAFEHASRSLALSDQSGALAVRRTCLINLANLFYAVGEFQSSIKHFDMANAVLPSSGEYASAIFDGVARVRLCENLIEECAELLDLVEAAATTPEHRGGYVYRNSKLTRVRLLERQNRLDAAILTIEEVIQLAKETTDRLLYQVALLTKAEILQQLGRIDETLAALDLVAPALAEQPPDLWAHYDRILACALLAAGETGAALPHLHRARRLYESIRSAPGLLELSRRWDETLAARANGDPAGSLLDAGERPRLPLPVLAAAAPEIDAADRPAEAPSPDPGRAACGTPDREAAAISARDVLQTAAGLLRHHSRPELVARELVHLLGGTGTVAAARALSVGSDGDEQVLAAWTADPAADTLPRRFSIGIARDRAVELELRLRPGIEARATAHTVALLLATIRDLESARVEREERLSLWPSDEDEAGEGTVAGGQMRSLMAIARRIATTNVSVLITGESGTGKEVLARAIHRYSDRAAKPFVPFNCAAVPRDMLESQLFGYRRGSFTGADRDHPGVIGAARDGTLFLDEIGELGLDLQPKLLRFLESGEVCPIGESTPFTLSVRVIAATNADIEQHVREGRFREDLFYRLNVIRLQVPPLRERRDEIPALVRHFLDHAAGEFRKGNVTVSEETMEHLLLCRWPGNVRQLQNEIRRMVALAEPNAVLAPAALSPEVFNARLAGRLVPGEFEMLVPLKAKLQPTLAKVETAMIRLALRDHQANLNAAAAALGISRKGLYLKRQRLGL